MATIYQRGNEKRKLMDRQYNGQAKKDNRTNTDLQDITQIKTKQHEPH
jgi:hypothetical protein